MNSILGCTVFLVCIWSAMACVVDNNGTIDLLPCLATMTPTSYWYIPVSPPVTTCSHVPFIRESACSFPPNSSLVNITCSVLVTTSQCTSSQLGLISATILIMVLPKVEDGSAYRSLRTTRSNSTVLIVSDKSVFGQSLLNPNFKRLKTVAHPACGSKRGLYCDMNGIVAIGGNVLVVNGTIVPYSPAWQNVSVIDLARTSTSSIVGGTLDTQYDRMTNLHVFDLSYATELVATIRPAWAAWKSLRHFRVFNTRFNGTLDPFADLTQLVCIEVDVTMVSGTMPSNLGNNPNFSRFLATGNLMSGGIPDSMSKLPQMIFFYAQRSLMGGTIPPGLSSWSGLQVFEMSTTALSGTIPKELSTWTVIQQFRVASTRVSGTLPPELSTWTQLVRFEVLRTQLSGTIPASWISWSSIQSFNAYETFLSGALPVLNGTQLLRFDVSQTNVSQGSFPSFTALKSGTGIVFRKTGAAGVVPTSWSSLQLTLDFSDCNVSFPNNFVADVVLCGGCSQRFQSYIPSAPMIDFSMTKWVVLPRVPPVVRTLYLDDAAFVTPPSASWFQNLNALAVLSMQRCNLQGTIPITLLYNISNLNLQGNHLSGTLPELTSRSQLKVFNVAHNDISGTLPSSWGNLAPNLQELIIINNYVSGGIPSAWMNLKFFRVFRAALNSIKSLESSAFPPALEVLGVSYNTITGTFPQTLSTHTTITEINVRETYISTLPNTLPPNIAVLDVARCPWKTPIPSWFNQSLPKTLVYLDVTPLLYVEAPRLVLQGSLQYMNTPYGARDLTKAVARRESISAFVLNNFFPKYMFNNITPALEAAGLKEDFCFLFPIPCANPTTTYNFANYEDCRRSCNAPLVRLAYQPFAPRVGVFPPPTLEFIFPSTPLTRLCTCPPFEDYFANQNLVQFYTAAIDPRPPQGCSWCDILGSFGPLVDGAFQLPNTDVSFLFGVKYTLRVDVHTVGVVTSEPFELMQCENVQQAGVINSTLCSACPRHGVCNGTYIIVTNENVWRPSIYHSEFLTCDDSAQPCRKVGRGARLGYECWDGHTGILCSSCLPGYGMSGQVCAQCPEEAISKFLVSVAILGILMFFVVMSFNACPNDEEDVSSPQSDDQKKIKKKKEENTIFGVSQHALMNAFVVPVQRLTKIILTYLFSVGVLAQSGAAKQLTSFARTMFEIQRDVSTASPLTISAFNCLVEFPVKANLVVYAGCTIPIAVIVSGLIYFFNRICNLGQKKKWPVSVWSIIVCVFTLMYPQMAVSVLNMLRCEVYKVGLWDGTTTTYNVLYADMRISCDSAEYSPYRIGAILSCIFGVIGFPVSCYFLRRYVPHEAFNFLSSDVRDGAWWWELTVMVRKAVFLAVVSLATTPGSEMICYTLVAHVSMVLLILTRPYESSLYNYLDGFAISSCHGLALLILLVSEYPDAAEGFMVCIVLLVFVCCVVIFVCCVRIFLEAWRTVKHGKKDEKEGEGENTGKEHELSQHNNTAVISAKEEIKSKSIVAVESPNAVSLEQRTRNSSEDDDIKIPPSPAAQKSTDTKKLFQECFYEYNW